MEVKDQWSCKGRGFFSSKSNIKKELFIGKHNIHRCTYWKLVIIKSYWTMLSFTTRISKEVDKKCKGELKKDLTKLFVT